MIDNDKEVREPGRVEMISPVLVGLAMPGHPFTTLMAFLTVNDPLRREIRRPRAGQRHQIASFAAKQKGPREAVQVSTGKAVTILGNEGGSMRSTCSRTPLAPNQPERYRASFYLIGEQAALD